MRAVSLSSTIVPARRSMTPRSFAAFLRLAFCDVACRPERLSFGLR